MFIEYPQDENILLWTIFRQDIQWWIFQNCGNYTITNNRSHNIAGYVTLYVLGQVGYLSLLENTTEYLRYYYHSQCFIAKVLSDLSK